MSLEIDEDLLKTCCKTIADNSNKLEQAYRELKENFERSKSSMDKTTLEVYQHYGLEQDKKDVESGKLTGVDFLVGREEDIAKLTRNMAGFGMEKSQRVTIEYDKGYGYFIVKHSQMEYGASKETYIIK